MNGGWYILLPEPQKITLDIDRGLSIFVHFRRNAVILVSTAHKLRSCTIHPTLELAECPERTGSLGPDTFLATNP